MCVTDLELDLDDLDLDHEITEDEQAPGVAWGRAGQQSSAG